MPSDRSTIAAIATARGSSGIGIVRLSGPDAWVIAQQLTPHQRPLRDRTACYRKLLDPATGTILDEGILLAMRGPRSYTGEDTVELQLHGSPLLLARVVDLCCQLGARPARPGEYTFRALMAGKLSLLQAEAVRDLIDAGSEEELDLARSSLFHDTSQPFRDVLQKVTAAAACLEGPIDFPDQFTDEDDREAAGRAHTLAIQASQGIAPLLAEAAASARVRRGVTVVIAGAPNVGKSSLMNALLRYPRVIVSSTPGTTRDTVSEAIMLGRHRVTLIDTAGISPVPQDALDSMAGDRSRAALQKADIVLLVLDAAAGIQPCEEELLARIKPLPHFIAVNKRDLAPVPEAIAQALHGERFFAVSATAGLELDHLTAALEKMVEEVSGAATARTSVTERQAAELTTTNRQLQAFLQAVPGTPADELTCLLGEAREALLRLLGENLSQDDLLSTVFSTFCIGK